MNETLRRRTTDLERRHDALASGVHLDREALERRLRRIEGRVSELERNAGAELGSQRTQVFDALEPDG